MSKIKTVVNAVPGLSTANLVKIGFIGLGVVGDVIYSMVQSAAAADPRIFIQELALAVANANGNVIMHVNDLHTGVEWWTFLLKTVFIAAALFIPVLLIKLLSIPFKGFVVQPDYSQSQYLFTVIGIYVLVAIICVAPLQYAGAMYADSTTEDMPDQAKIPYYGYWSVASNMDLWIDPAINLAQSTPYLGQYADSLDPLTPENTTVNRSSEDGVQVIQ